MKTISLTQKYNTIVSDEDFERLSAYRWHYAHGYAARGVWKNNKFKMIYMHREILELTGSLHCDHADNNRLNNLRNNLRVTTRSQNMANRKIFARNKSGYKGVSWDKSSNLWRAQIRINNKSITIARSLNKELLARLYNQKAIKLFGSFASINEGV